MSEYRHLRVERSQAIATITVDRPDQLNAIDRAAMAELDDVVAEVERDADVRGVIITGAGTKSFVAGADINDLATMTPVTGVELSRRGQAVFRRIELSRKVFVAAVNGFALGGGCELALACHMRVASINARFGFPEVKLGILPGYGGTVRLPRVIGKGRAMEMILTGEMVGAEEAFRIGLVNRLVGVDELMGAARKLVGQVVANGPLAVGLAIESTSRGMEVGIEDALALESTFFGFLASTADLKEGVTAFLEKRPPSFEGR
jgi:enoyl-CoA hydratase